MRWGRLYRFYLSLGIAALIFAPSHFSLAQVRDVGAQARVEFERGNDLYEEAMRLRGPRRVDRLEQALRAYVASLSIVRSRNVIFNAALTCEALDRPVEAFNFLAEYLNAEDLSEDDREEATTRLDRLRQEVGVLQIRSTPAGAEVRLDRLDLPSLGQTPLEVAVSPGPHRVFVSAEHHQGWMESIQVERGESADLSATLTPNLIRVRFEAPTGSQLTLNQTPISSGIGVRVEPGVHEVVMRMPGRPTLRRQVDIAPDEGGRVITLESPVPFEERGVLRIVTPVNATVFVDGVPTSEGRVHQILTTPGAHTIRVEAPGHVAYTTRVTLAEDSPVQLRAELAGAEGSARNRRQRGQIWAGVSTGIAAAATGVAIFFANDAHQQWEDAASLYEETQSEDDRQSAIRAADSLDRANLVADIGLGITVATAVTTLILVLTGDSDETPARLTVAPIRGGGFIAASMEMGP